MKIALPVVLAAAALAAAGCGSSGNSSSSNSSPDTSGSAGTTAAAPATTSTESSSSGKSTGKSASVDMRNIAFDPKDTTVKVGQKVEWENYDNVDHNVTADSGEFKSKDFGKAGKFSYTPTKAGKITYACTLHPGMTATLNVTG